MSDTETSYKENYVESLRQELVGIVEEKLSPLAEKYSYSKTRLEAGISWKPVVLVLGNYSSGKSTLINELIGADIQKTGQAPTDDSFTVITQAPAEQQDMVIDRDGMVLLNDPTYPFESFKKHGKRFASHFRLKSVKSDFLANLAIIDTPGMLDSVSEKDRGYDYQEVIGEMAKLADLILILFDPHKAGTIRETYQSLRETLPASTYEDRVMFVLNRVDECENLNDLLRVSLDPLKKLIQCPHMLHFGVVVSPLECHNEHHHIDTCVRCIRNRSQKRDEQLVKRWHTLLFISPSGELWVFNGPQLGHTVDLVER